MGPRGIHLHVAKPQYCHLFCFVYLSLVKTITYGTNIGILTLIDILTVIGHSVSPLTRWTLAGE